MTLENAKELLASNGIPFETCHYANETEYWRHLILFPYVKHAKPCEVTALVVHCPNGKKNIELQFNAVDNEYLFVDLSFGGYSFELFDCQEEFLSHEILREIQVILQGQTAVIEANDLKHRRWSADAIFDRSDKDDPAFGEPGYQKAIAKIHKPLSFIQKLFHAREQYEIFDSEHYQCIIKE